MHIVNDTNLGVLVEAAAVRRSSPDPIVRVSATSKSLTGKEPIPFRSGTRMASQPSILKLVTALLLCILCNLSVA